MTVALVFAGGSGMRMGANQPKQFIEINGLPVLAHTLLLFQKHPHIDGIYLVCNAEFRERTEDVVRRFGIAKVCRVVDGGDSAQDSIYRGLKAVAAVCADDTVVLIHDGVRPYVTPEVIDANIASVRENGNAVTYTPCYETLVISRDGREVSEIPRRRESFTAQAPQSFRLGDILAVHEKVRSMPSGYADLVDQATICWTLGIPIHLVPGNRGNLKITTREDVYILRALLNYHEDLSNGKMFA